jgi:hypothetical protein
MELHTRSTEANGFDCHARLGRTGHKERTPWLADHRDRKDDDGTKPAQARRLFSQTTATRRGCRESPGRRHDH